MSRGVGGSGQSTVRPFHETFGPAIQKSGDPDRIYLIETIVETTKIPANHDAIIAYIKKRYGGLFRWKEMVIRLEGLILQQKRIAEAEVAETKEETVKTPFENLEVGDFYRDHTDVLHRKIDVDGVAGSVAVDPLYKAIVFCPSPGEIVQKIVRRGR